MFVIEAHFFKEEEQLISKTQSFKIMHVDKKNHGHKDDKKEYVLIKQS